MYYEHKEHDGSLPIIGVKTFLGEEGKLIPGGKQALMRSTTEEIRSRAQRCHRVHWAR